MENRPASPAELTKSVVDAAAPAAKRYIVWETGIRGFGLLVLPSGVKSYIFQYRNAYGVSRRATIGRHGAITPKQAREKVRELAAAVQVDKRDVVAEGKAKRNAHTIADVLDAYLASAKFAEKAESTRLVDKGRIERHIRPRLGDKVLADLKREAIRKFFADIRDGKTAARIKTKLRGLAKVRGGEGTARAAVRLLRSILNWAIEEGLATENVAAGINIGRDGEREAMLDAEQYGRFFRILEELESTREIRQAAADAIRVIALTGARRGEIINLRWNQVDLKKGLLILPPKAHKAGKRTGKPRLIALPAAAQAIIARQSGAGSDAFVFEPTKGEGAISLQKPWNMIRAKAELPADFGLHGLRHSLASMMAVQGASAAELMVALGHHQIATTVRYVHFAQDARVALLEKHTAGIAAALEKRDPAKVTPIKGDAS